MINSMKRFNKICVYLILLNFCSNYFSASCISSRSTFKNEQNIDETEEEFYQCNDGINGTCSGEKLKCDGTRIRHRCNGCDKWAMMCDAPSVKIGKERSSGDYCTTLSPSPHKTTTFYNYNGDANSKCYAADRLIREFSHFSQIITCRPNYMRSVFEGVWWPSIDEYYKANNRILENADYYGILVDKVSRNYCSEEIRNQKIFNVTGWGVVSSAGDSGGKMLSFTDFQPYEYITFNKLRAGSETGEARRKMPINSQDKDTFYQLIIICTVMLCMISTISVTIHLLKFLQSEAPQSLSTRNLTFYCFFLLLIYIFTIIRFALLVMDLKDYLLDSMIIIEHLILTSTFIKFVIALDLFLCFRKIAIYLQNTCSLATQNEKFIIYCLLGIGIPLFYTLIFHYLCNFQTEYLISYYGPFAIVRYIRFTRLFLIIGAYWYIRSASMERKELWSKYGLHLRMLTMLGGVSALISIAEVVSIVMHKDEYYENYPKSKVDVTSVYFFIHYLGCSLEGIVIGVLFTFREETFQPIPIPSPTASSNGTSRQQIA